MEEELEELYVEGLATRGGPESCVDDLRGRGEALAGARAGRAIEPRNHLSGVPTLSLLWKATSLAALDASCRGAPRGQRTMACTEPSCARTGRSRVLPVGLITGRAAQETPRR
jgi:hypothetical protein